MPAKGSSGSDRPPPLEPDDEPEPDDDEPEPDDDEPEPDDDELPPVAPAGASCRRRI